ncbi:MAG: HNH endonuclease [Nitrospira sp.]|nr:HNH endonuclease [Nitrospira sp.]
MISELFNLALTPELRVNTRGRFVKKWPSKDEIRAFYRSEAWKLARYKQLVRSSRCAACGASAQDGAHMNVDHIKPLHQYWDLRLNPRNLQTLCASCNWGKGSTEKDWRVQPQKRRSKDCRADHASAWKR